MEAMKSPNLIPEPFLSSLSIHAVWPQGRSSSVVDPGVGTNRRACVARTSNGYFIVTPDNGSLTHVKTVFGIDEVREIDETINRLRGMGTDDVSVFHGRDLFSYCAARFASGKITFEKCPAQPDETSRIPLMNRSC